MRWLVLIASSIIFLSCGRDSGVIPRPEHPRPEFERAQWLNLNGRWDFRFDPTDRGVGEGWQRSDLPWEQQITVPFCWESDLSGIGEKAGQQIGWYRREIAIPADWGGRRIWLRFEAVDWEAQVWIDGVPVGEHAGGYTPFAFDITGNVGPGESATLVVRAFDPTDRELPTGKQIAFWYTFTSGIWQTVWLEARPPTYLESLQTTPRRDGERWELAVKATLAGPDGTATLRLSSPDETVAAAQQEVTLSGGTGRWQGELVVDSPRLWTPDEPNLYDLRVEVTGPDGETDIVSTYFGLRTIGRGVHGDASYESILLNGDPVYLRGALDQSFNPEGIHTAPSDEFLRRDIELAKELGLNFLRIHIKADEPRRLYWADKLGILLMADMPNTWEYSESARQAWESTMREVIARDRNHPSIMAWCLFNETWGIGGDEYKQRPDIQEWVKARFYEVQELDPSRLVEDNSPNRRDHVVTDINSWHFYIDDEARAREHIEEVVARTYPGSTFNYAPGHRQGAAPLINSEYGAVSAGGGDRDISWGFRYLTTELRRHEKIQGYVYTELTDVEFEHNGFVNYDRSPKEFGYDAWVDDMTVADLQGEDFVGFDSLPVIVAEPGQTLRIPTFVSHWSDVEGEIWLKPRLVGVDDLGRTIRVELDKKPVTWQRYRVTMQAPLVVTVPDRPFAGAMAMELADDQDNRLAANFVNIVVPPSSGARSPARQNLDLIDAHRVVLRVSPRSIAASRWTGAGVPPRLARRQTPGKYFIQGAGIIEYRFELPEEVVAADPVRVGLLMEIATAAHDERLDWPQTTTPLDYPQTDGNNHPGSLNIYLNGHALAPVSFANDPADARGLLSHLAKSYHGSYGYLVSADVPLVDLPGVSQGLRQNPEIRVVLEVPPGEGAAGLSIYGAHSGQFPIDPSVIVETERDIEWQ